MSSIRAVFVLLAALNAFGAHAACNVTNLANGLCVTCNDGYYGAACSTTAKPNPTGLLPVESLGICCGLMLMIAMAWAVTAWGYATMDAEVWALRVQRSAAFIGPTEVYAETNISMKCGNGTPKPREGARSPEEPQAAPRPATPAASAGGSPHDGAASGRYRANSLAGMGEGAASSHDGFPGMPRNPSISSTRPPPEIPDAEPVRRYPSTRPRGASVRSMSGSALVQSSLIYGALFESVHTRDEPPPAEEKAAVHHTEGEPAKQNQTPDTAVPPPPPREERQVVDDDDGAATAGNPPVAKAEAPPPPTKEESTAATVSTQGEPTPRRKSPVKVRRRSESPSKASKTTEKQASLVKANATAEHEADSPPRTTEKQSTKANETAEHEADTPPPPPPVESPAPRPAPSTPQPAEVPPRSTSLAPLPPDFRLEAEAWQWAEQCKRRQAQASTRAEDRPAPMPHLQAHEQGGTDVRIVPELARRSRSRSVVDATAPAVVARRVPPPPSAADDTARRTGLHPGGPARTDAARHVAPSLPFGGHRSRSPTEPSTARALSAPHQDLPSSARSTSPHFDARLAMKETLPPLFAVGDMVRRTHKFPFFAIDVGGDVGVIAPGGACVVRDVDVVADHRGHCVFMYHIVGGVAPVEQSLLELHFTRIGRDVPSFKLQDAATILQKHGRR
jgi:hypothetical protein